LLVLLGLATLSTGGVLAVACGLDVAPLKPADVILPDAGGEASVVPRPDADNTVDTGVPPPDDATTPEGCPATHGPMMVRLPDSGTCVDSTEVTNAQYDEFLLATDGGVPGTLPDGGVPARCTDAPSYARGAITVPPGLDAGVLPATMVNWCSASAFCAWSNKRLCGGLDPADASSGEWWSGCSNNGAFLYPYGPVYVGGNCNDTSSAVEPVASRVSCEGGAPGLHDMSGNAEEWVDRCDLDTDAAACIAQGGYWGNGAVATCSQTVSYGHGTQGTGIGFRCCATAK